jgi:hypothetical protein
MDLHITDAVDLLTQAICKAVERAGVLCPTPTSQKHKKQRLSEQCAQLRRVKRQSEHLVRSFILPHGKHHAGCNTLQLVNNPAFREAKTNLSQATRQYNAALRQDRTNRWRRMVYTINLATQPATVWKLIKSLRAAKARNPQAVVLLTPTAQNIWSPQDQCNALAQHFSTISTTARQTDK